MSAEYANRVRALAVDTATRAAWAQWAALGAGVVADGELAARSVVDPEALILVSLASADAERRLEDVLGAWAGEGASLLSVQRLESLAAAFPEGVRGRIGDWARYAREAGDRRWRRMVREPSPEWPTPRGKPFGTPDLRSGPGLMLRMRAGFGVGCKGDALTFLLANGGIDRTVRQVVEATGYTDRAVRTALEEMERAGFVIRSSGHPTAYRVDPDRWAPLLGLEAAVPEWRQWAILYGFLTTVARWSEEAAAAGWSPYVFASRGRSLVETHQQELRTAGFEQDLQGTDPNEMVHLMERLQEWTWERL